MELTDALRIPLDPSIVAESLDDGALLRASLENCESFERRPGGEYALVVTVPVGPLRGRYDVRMHMMTSPGGAYGGVPAGGEHRLSRTLNLKASAAGVGSLRGQVTIELEADSERADEQTSARGSTKAGVDDAGATRVQYAIWATLTGPLAELAPRQVENALQALADDFFAEFSAVLQAKYGKGPNRARSGAAHRQHVFLRPISLAGLSRRTASTDPLDPASRRSGDAMIGQRGAESLGRRRPQAMPAWAWAAAFAVGIALLYLLHRFE
ncbi:carbon monoxide dehydrogenase subunit G [Trinickia symbiotica]|uniref:Carbon monoxide dehydrogenase n=1 Tax=Trinickia symbiotica TaxID=863227 RepID=A0A2N7WU47_9BURK|nr:SRPBCC domain-containing protein [Trinickia symbiotica]PMS32785.1 carbon monoxide dehydrogenase [Trinickia symbiotica]PPK42114.1 carbon monoxide dehydrogenase subunit G [Trinickia symbiotica]